MYTIILLTFFASTSAFVIVNSPCPEIKTVDSFNFDAFAQGTWYEYAAYPNINVSSCNNWYYSREGESVRAYRYSYYDGKLYSAERYVKLDPNVSGKLIYSLPDKPSDTSSEIIINVLASDNKNYVLGYNCKYNEEKGSRVDRAWIFSRLKTLTSEIETEINNYLTTSKFLDKSKFNKTDFTEEICMYF